ncbi:MAG: M20/M25/M40 family metallo-hydrolase [Verrucomicrobiota bacterium]
MESIFDDPIALLKTFVAHASVSTDPDAAEHMVGAREFVVDLLNKLEFDCSLVETPLHPVIVAQRGADLPEGTPHIVIYGHYDVQPADPLDLWETPPFAATQRGERLYGRGAADNKGEVITHLCALAKVFSENPRIPLRITYLIEGEEEIGSPNFSKVLDAYSDLLRSADFVLVSDTSIPTAEQVAITTQLRGLVDFEFTLTGPKMDLHSGEHGGAIRNTIQALSELLSTLHLEDGRVNVPGFYDDVLDFPDWEREELKKLPENEEAYARFLGVDSFYVPESMTPFEHARFMPTLEMNGIGGGYQGPGSKTVIPSKAFVKITCRLVPNQEPEDIFDKVKRTLEERLPSGVTMDLKKKAGAPAYLVVPPGRSNSDPEQPKALSDAFYLAESAFEQTFGSRPLYIRGGGSIPIIGMIRDKTGLDALMIGLATPEDRIHSPNESFHLGVMKKGIEAFEQVFRGLARA